MTIVLFKILLFAVHFFRVEEPLSFDQQTSLLNPSKKTGFMTGMTGRAAKLLNLKNYRVVIAIDKDFPDQAGHVPMIHP